MNRISIKVCCTVSTEQAVIQQYVIMFVHSVHWLRQMDAHIDLNNVCNNVKIGQF